MVQEPHANWIEENDQIQEKDTRLNGEILKGNALYFFITAQYNELEY